MTSVVFRSISRACGGNALCIEILTGSAEGLGTVVGIAGVIGSVIFMTSDAPPSVRAANTKPKAVPGAGGQVKPQPNQQEGLVECTLSGPPFQDPFDPTQKICAYSCSDKIGRIRHAGPGEDCPGTFWIGTVTVP